MTTVSPLGAGLVNADGTLSAKVVTQLLNDIRNGLITVWASGTAAQRPVDPYLGQWFFDTNLSLPIFCTAVRAGAVAATWASVGGGGGGTVTSITATAPIVVTPSPITNTGVISITGGNQIGSPFNSNLGVWAAWHTAHGGNALGVSEFNVAAANIQAGTAVVMSTSNVYDSYHKQRQTTTVAANQSCGIQCPTLASQAQVTLGSAAGCGGFYLKLRFGIQISTGTLRVWAGLGSTNETLALDPSVSSTAHQMLGLIADSADANLSLFAASGTGGAGTKTALGANFPKTAGNLYQLEISAAGNNANPICMVTNLVTGNNSGLVTLSATLPAGTTTFFPAWVIGNASSGVAVSGDDVSLYIEAAF